MNVDKSLLTTPRLILRLPNENDFLKLQEFDQRNQSHFSPWESASVTSKIDYQKQLMRWNQEIQEDRSIRFIIFLKEKGEDRIIGLCSFTQIFRAAFQACYLGYKIDSQYEGKGLMFEALKEAVRYMFEEKNIHRIMANYMPSNERSAKLLQRLGFVTEGVAKGYLLINGHWEDHVLTSLTNFRWFLPEIPKK